MSVLPVFGTNLRHLCNARGSIAESARNIGVNSVQFGRYLKGESFPKPNTLQSICDYFGVDARILTEPLTEADLRLVKSGQSLRSFLPMDGSFAEAMNFVMPSDFLFSNDPNLPDGLYALYRRSPSFPSKVNANILQVRTLVKSRVLRGYQHKSTSKALGDPAGASEREFRGIIYRQREGFAVSTIHAEPDNIICHYYFTPYASVPFAFSGVILTCRSENAIARVPASSRSGL